MGSSVESPTDLHAKILVLPLSILLQVSRLGHLMSMVIKYRIRQNIRGGKLSRFSRILAKHESFTIESFPSSQLENFIIIP